MTPEMSARRSVSFAEVETVRCPKCASEPSDKCWVVAGKVITSKTKVVPHLERAIKYFDDNPVPSPKPEAGGKQK